MIVTISQEKAVEVFKENFELRFNVIKKENPADWLRLKEIFISDIKNDKELTEKSKDEIIEFINNLVTEEIMATDDRFRITYKIGLALGKTLHKPEYNQQRDRLAAIYNNGKFVYTEELEQEVDKISYLSLYIDNEQ